MVVLLAQIHTEERSYMNPLVSIIIPIYNAAPYLKETLDSVMQSTYRPIEVVMVDDGSKDDSLIIAQQFCTKHPECRVIVQSNKGVSVARNNAIKNAKGEYILPVDADDKIGCTYIQQAVQILQQQPEVRMVGCRAWMFGDVDKEWKLPKFSHALLARKNMIPVTALYRKSDWEKCGGYCETDIYREDWDFWLSMMELGGTFHKIDEVLFFYRITKGSRRTLAKSQKKYIIDAINRRHPAYLKKYLGGPLHYQRSWSRIFNFLRRETIVGNFQDWQEGEIIFSRRNTLRKYKNNVCKQFAKPNILRGIIYGWFTPSKACRSYEYAKELGNLTPTPIAYKEVRYVGVLRDSWYVCQSSDCAHTFNELINNPTFPKRTQILEAIGKFTAELHRKGVLHQDYSGGNILFNEDGSKIQVIDLNRIRFQKHIKIEQGLKNFERLNIDKQALTILGYAYAKAMNIDPDYAVTYIITHRWKKHIKQGITNLYE
jgi:glycosyltransferase involved in cell wall biosynthesis